MPSIDCLLLHVPQVFYHSAIEYKTFVNFMPMGMFSMANELKTNKIKTKIIHLGVEKALNIDFDIANYVKKNKIKIIGLSLHWHFQTYDVLNVAKHIKNICPNCFIFLGGLTASAFANEILKKYSYIDAIIKGEGEKPIVKLVSKLINNDADLKQIPNLYWKDKHGKLHKNTQKWFASEQELNTYKFDNLKILQNIDTYLRIPFFFTRSIKKDSYTYSKEKTICCCLGRGCLGNCTWCGGGYNAVKNITGRDSISIRNPKIVANEIINLNKKYDIDVFYICYDPFPQKQDFILELFDILGKKNPNKINISFECFGLPNKTFMDSFKKNLKQNSLLIISPEFGNEELRAKHKTFYYSNEELFECLDYITDKNINCFLYFSKLPYETTNETQDFIDNCIKPKYKNIGAALQNIYNIEPYSPWAMEPQKYNIDPKQLTFDHCLKVSKLYRDFI